MRLVFPLVYLQEATNLTAKAGSARAFFEQQSKGAGVEEKRAPPPPR